ncbi:MAG TPA: hypothetical protein VIQ31_26335 [Phormidium sp.]
MSKETKLEKAFEARLEEVANELRKTIPSISLEEITTDDMIEATVNVMRRQVYRDYPVADPKVVEALLLMYKCYFYDLNNGIESMPKSALTEEKGETLIKEAIRFARAFNKTLKRLHD